MALVTCSVIGKMSAQVMDLLGIPWDEQEKGGHEENVPGKKGGEKNHDRENHPDRIDNDSTGAPAED